MMSVVMKLRTSNFIGSCYHEAPLFRARVHCYYCLYIIFSANPVRGSEGLNGDPIMSVDILEGLDRKKLTYQ